MKVDSDVYEKVKVRVGRRERVENGGKKKAKAAVCGDVFGVDLVRVKVTERRRGVRSLEIGKRERRERGSERRGVKRKREVVRREEVSEKID